MADSSKTEQATPQRQKKARESGQIARSREFPGALALGAAGAVLAWMAPMALSSWAVFYRSALNAGASGDFDANGPILFWGSIEVLRNIVPVLFGAMVVSAFAGFAQGGFNLAPKALAPKFDRFNPATRLGQIFSPIGLSNLLKSLVPVAAILWVSISALRGQWQFIVHSTALGIRPFFSLLGSMTMSIAWKSVLILLAWSAVDYLLVWRKTQNDMKMTKQEVKQEVKESDGDPAIKRRVRQIQREMRKRQSLKAAETASVIITNPTHYAVALRYTTDMSAPVVVAKGLNQLAEKIKQIGRDNSIPLIENRPLAQALYKSAEIGDTIPASLYHAVAEILAMIFRAEAELRRKDAERRSRNASGQKTGPGGLPTGESRR
jgi:flagellar biosynthetic protein FlhB